MCVDALVQTYMSWFITMCNKTCLHLQNDEPNYYSSIYKYNNIRRIFIDKVNSLIELEVLGGRIRIL